MLIPLIVPDFSTRNERRTYRASTPNINKSNRRFRANGLDFIIEFVHFGLSAGSRELATAIFSSPDALAFSLMSSKVAGRSRGGQAQ